MDPFLDILVPSLPGSLPIAVYTPRKPAVSRAPTSATLSTPPQVLSTSPTSTLLSRFSSRSDSFSGPSSPDGTLADQVDIAELCTAMEESARGRDKGKSRDKPRAGFMDLPWELRIRVLRRFDQVELVRMSRVSHSFKRLCFDGSLWSHVDLSEHARFVDRKAFESLAAAAGGFLREVNLRGCAAIPSQSFTHIPHLGPHVHTLDLRGCLGLTPSSLVHLFSGLAALKHVDLTGLPSVTGAALEALGKTSKGLESVKVGWCRGVSGSGIRHLARNAPNLRHLHVPSLPIDPDTLLVVARRVPLLTSLDIRHCALITPAAMRSFLETLAQSVAAVGVPLPTPIAPPNSTDEPTPPTQLARLFLTGCNLLDDATITRVAKHSPALETLECAGLRHVGDTACASLSTYCPHLRFLDLEDYPTVTDTSLSHLSHLIFLSGLTISGCDRVTDDGVVHLLRGCVHLKSLDMDGCTNLTDGLLERVAAMRVRARAVVAVARAVKGGRKEGRPERKDSGYGGDDMGSSSSVPPALWSDTAELVHPLPTSHLARIEVRDCRSITREACRALEKRGGVEVRSFWSAAGEVRSARDEEQGGQEGGGGDEGGRRRRRRGNCVIL